MKVLLRLPGQFPERFTCIEVEGDGDCSECFVLARFNERAKCYSIIERFPLSEPAVADAESKVFEFGEAGKDAYCAGLTRLIDSLKTEGGKTVICRQIHATTEASVEDIFGRLCSRYPDAAVYAWQDGDSFWIGATPELLLKADNQKLSTMSLAGTRPAGGTAEEWDAKNIEEQAIVTEFILDELRNCGLHPEVAETGSRKAGPVEHICSLITAEAPAGSALAVAEKLSPTPAVAGYPRQRALRQIDEVESAPREYYAGFFGLCSQDFRELYVTLRCMKVSASGEVTIYSGGGITHASVPEKEWEETCVKASTLLNVIN